MIKIQFKALKNNKLVPSEAIRHWIPWSFCEHLLWVLRSDQFS